MENNRLPKICLLRLIHLHRQSSANPAYNWVSQFDELLVKVNMCHLWDTPQYENWKNAEKLAFERFDRFHKFEDVLACNNASSMNCAVLRSLGDSSANYLKFKSCFIIIKTFIQLRLSNTYNLRFCIKGQIFRIDQNTHCTVCLMQTNETLSHFFFECPLYTPFRDYYLTPLYNCQSVDSLANHIDVYLLKSIFYYISNSLKLRAQILNI